MMSVHFPLRFYLKWSPSEEFLYCRFLAPLKGVWVNQSRTPLTQTRTEREAGIFRVQGSGCAAIFPYRWVRGVLISFLHFVENVLGGDFTPGGPHFFDSSYHRVVISWRKVGMRRSFFPLPSVCNPFSKSLFIFPPRRHCLSPSRCPSQF